MAGRNDYVSFIFTSPSNRSYGFRTYTDELGRELGFVDGYDKNKQPIYHRWKWDQDGSRILTVHKNKTDKSSDKPEECLNAVDFLRNSPNCLGSPRGTFSHEGVQMDIFFREINEEKSAEVALEVEMKRMEAQNLALS